MKSIVKKGFVLCILLIMLSENTISSKAYVGNSGEIINSATFKSDYSITSIHIGRDVYEITSNAFRNLINLNTITVSDNNPFYAAYSGCLYDKFFTELLCYPPTLAGAYIPETVVSIGPYALHGVPEDLKEAIISAVEANASENYMEWEIPGEHFIHDGSAMKWKLSDGTVIMPDSQLMNLTASLVGMCTNSSMKQSEQLKSSFDFFTQAMTYERSYEVPYGNWVKDYAQEALLTKKANCYGYAAAFAYVADGLGYDARVCTGTVTSSLGGRTAHAWTEVKIGGKWYVFDTEMQDAKGDGYYKVTYDEYPAGPIERTSSFSVSF